MAETRRLSGWEIAGIVGGILTPLMIAAGTLYLNHQIALRAQQNEAQQSRLARLALVPAFIDALTGPDDRKRVLALRSINRILPEDAGSLLEGVVDAEISPETTTAAQAALRVAALRPLAEGLYASDLSSRRSAFQSLTEPAIDKSDATRAILDQMTNSPWHLNGTVNAWNVLNAYPVDVLSAFADEIWKLELLTKGNGPQTAKVAEQVRKRATAT